MSSLTLSLVIPAYNEEKYIWSCLEHALKHGAGYITEIIVIDNASTDATKSIAASYPSVRVITEQKKGVSFARQRWYEESTGDIIACVDADTRIPQDWAKKMVDIFAKDPKVGFVTGPYSYYDMPRWFQIWSWLYSRTLMYLSYLIVGYIWIGGNFGIRRSTLDKMQGFDTSIAFYGDDTNAARRAAQFGKTLYRIALEMPTSARRFAGQWLLHTMYIYTLNFLSEAIRHKPATTTHKDFR